MTKLFQARQGDVFIQQVDALPEKITEMPRDEGRTILAYGEVTGHAHAFMDSRAVLFREDGSGSGLFLRVSGDVPAALKHEEHTTIDVPPGVFRIVRQVEFPRKAPVRQVTD